MGLKIKMMNDFSYQPSLWPPFKSRSKPIGSLTSLCLGPWCRYLGGNQKARSRRGAFLRAMVTPLAGDLVVIWGDWVYVCRHGWMDKQVGGQMGFGGEVVVVVAVRVSRRRRQVWHCRRSSLRRWPCSAGCYGRPGRWCWPCSHCPALHGRTPCFPHLPQSPL